MKINVRYFHVFTQLTPHILNSRKHFKLSEELILHIYEATFRSDNF